MSTTRLDQAAAMREIAKVKNPHWAEEHWEAVSNRTPLLRKAAAAVHDRVGDELPMELSEPQAWAATLEFQRTVATLEEDTRTVFFESLFPTIAPSVERAWQMLKLGPTVRALGLVPLPERKGDAPSPAESSDVLSRYEAIQEFIRGSKEFGAQRRESEKRAAQIGLDNLARTAGYADPSVSSGPWKPARSATLPRVR